ncbi:MAG TPA: diguanylate cyclase [Pseudobacteroides sp.]|uniref:GGDEF domain-containing response regulator n=1 Tax=Pseudobacteroides sp. TaxID=1968840 RepID=UPI002F92B0B6
MARINSKKAPNGKRILLVDDQEDYRIVTQTLLEREGYEVYTASNGIEAIELVKQQHFDLVLLDYFMPGGMTGEEVVQEIRKFNEYIQVILQTGYSGEHPPRDMMRALDIQGYHDKSDGPEKLLLWVDVGLKSAYTVQMLYKSRQGLKYILEITPELHKIQMVENLLQGILLQVTGLLGIVNSFLAVLPEEADTIDNISTSDIFIAMLEEGTNLEIRAATGKFSDNSPIERSLEGSKIRKIKDALIKTEVYLSNECSIIPLVVGETALGIIYLEQNDIRPEDVELVNIFANQAAAAIQNAYLYSTATIDKLTGVYVRSFFIQQLMREIRASFRQKSPLSLILLDIDYLKQINDTAGHLGGDQALSIMGSTLKKSTRVNDIVGRYGGDEFIILLPNTPLENVHNITERIYENLQGCHVEGHFGSIPIQCSMGACGLKIQDFEHGNIPQPYTQSYLEEIAKLLIDRADKMLYQAKKNGRSCAVIEQSYI